MGEDFSTTDGATDKATTWYYDKDAPLQDLKDGHLKKGPRTVEGTFEELKVPIQWDIS